MVKEIIHDPILLGRISSDAAAEDVHAADDLLDTLRANRDRCVGMAANMIGELKRIIVFDDGGVIGEMFNPVILSQRDPFDAEEGCLSLDGTRKTKRYKTIKVQWQTRDMKPRIKTFSGWTAQIIQHEIDHLNGILIKNGEKYEITQKTVFQFENDVAARHHFCGNNSRDHRRRADHPRH